MAVDLSYLLADQDYYEPWHTADPGSPFLAGPMPAGWTRHVTGAWTQWSPPGCVLPDQGWKVHVSSSLVHAQTVLSVVSAACTKHDLSFKHLTGRRTFLMMHDKHAARVQAGKFCTIYPPDEAIASILMRQLADELAGVSGPYVLTDRRFGDSECVSYRYGAFRSRHRIDAEGRPIPVMTGPDGADLDDDRLPRFSLPDGLVDPFAEAGSTKAGRGPGPVTIHGYVFDQVVQHSNSGGAYLFRTPQDEPVFVKEARAHNGYTYDGFDAKTRLSAEYLTLRAIHARAPGGCPRPIELFQHWENSYLVTERVPGVSLYRWMVTHNPALHTGETPSAFAEYQRRCLALLDRLQNQLDRLHEAGFVFIDLSSANVLVDEQDGVRLIDFEAAQPRDQVRQVMGTPGYRHPDPAAATADDPRELDRFGLAALALMLLLPLHEAARRHPPVLHQLHADLTDLGPVSPRLWQRATRYHDLDQDSAGPTPAEVRAEPLTALRLLAERSADALESMAQPDHPRRIYPTTPLGHQSDTRAVAAGTAGVLLALHRAGRSCDPAVVRRLRDDSLAAAESSPPGLLYGSAGIAGVLAELGEHDAAAQLLSVAARHPLNDTSATLGGGAAGTAVGLLQHYRRTGDQRELDRATELLFTLPATPALDDRLSPEYRSGLVGGRTGIAYAFYQLHQLTGDEAAFDRGLRLLRAELDYARPLGPDGLGFTPSATDTRIFPYLVTGSAGYAAVLSRFLTLRPDAGFGPDCEYDARDVLEQCLRASSLRLCVYPGLFTGLAGPVLTLARAGRRLHRPELVEAALTSARGFFRNAIPHRDGIAWLGDPGQRLSADFWSGSAGILFCLHELLDPRPEPGAILSSAGIADLRR